MKREKRFATGNFAASILLDEFETWKLVGRKEDSKGGEDDSRPFPFAIILRESRGREEEKRRQEGVYGDGVSLRPSLLQLESCSRGLHPRHVTKFHGTSVLRLPEQIFGTWQPLPHPFRRETPPPSPSLSFPPR